MRVFRILTLLVIFSLLDDSLAKTKDQSEFVFVKLHKPELKSDSDSRSQFNSQVA